MFGALRRRPSPAMVVAIIALFVSLSGVSYGVATGFIDSREIKNNQVRSVDLRNNDIRTRDLRNNEVRGVDIRNSTVQGRDVALNTLTGADINESRLGKVPLAASADDARTLGGQAASAFVSRSSYVPFSAKLQAGEIVELARNGVVSISAECATGVGGTDDRIRLLAAITGPQGGMMQGQDDFDGSTSLLSTTDPSDRELALFDETTGLSRAANGDAAAGGFVLGPDGKGLVLPTDSLALALNYGGFRCLAAGVIVPVG